MNGLIFEKFPQIKKLEKGSFGQNLALKWEIGMQMGHFLVGNWYMYGWIHFQIISSTSLFKTQNQTWILPPDSFLTDKRVKSTLDKTNTKQGHEMILRS